MPDSPITRRSLVWSGAAGSFAALAGGEVLDSRASARDHIVRRSFDIIQPDVTLCGGVAEVLFIAEMARLFGVQCVPHCWGGALAPGYSVYSRLKPRQSAWSLRLRFKRPFPRWWPPPWRSFGCWEWR